MSDQNKPGRVTPPSKPPGPPTDRFQPKVLIIWMCILGALLSLWMLSGGTENRGPQPASLSQILSWATQDPPRVIKGSIRADPTGGPNWTVVSVELRSDGSQGNPRYAAAGRLTDENLQKLQATGLFAEVPSGSWLNDWLLTLVPLLILIAVIYFFFIRQIRNAGRGAMSFGKSRAKLTQTRDKVFFRDVAGCEEAKEEVAEIVDFLKDPKKFQKIGGRIPKGVLLVGPPGTGKTLIARAVAGEADVPFFTISGSDFVEMFVGVGAARVRDMFEQGRKNAPCIIFIDEIDAVGRQRGAGLGGGNDEREQTLNSLLVEMDGFDGHEGVIIMAATNRPDVLDSALLRPGRFDRQVTIDLPDLNGRVEILKVHAKKITLGKEVDLTVVARNTPGFSGADLANLLNEAALLAARYGKKEVDGRDIDEARDKVAFGRERRRLLSDHEKKVTAFHEAGHAIIASVIDDGLMPVHKVTIIPRGQALGLMSSLPTRDILNYTTQFALNRICVAVAGRVAEELAIGEVTNGASSDIKYATQLARRMVCDWGMSSLGMVAYGDNQEHIFLGREIARSQNYSEATAQKIDAEIRQIIETELARARRILSEKRTALDTLAQALLEHETVEGKHVREILSDGKISSPLTPPRPPPGKTGDAGKEAPKATPDGDNSTAPSPAPVPA